MKYQNKNTFYCMSFFLLVYVFFLFIISFFSVQRTRMNEYMIITILEINVLSKITSSETLRVLFIMIYVNEINSLSTNDANSRPYILFSELISSILCIDDSMGMICREYLRTIPVVFCFKSE